jgi:hypothetical protein
LSDDEVLRFVSHGYHLVETDLPPAFHAEVCDDLSRLTDNPGNAIYEQVPKLKDVYADPQVTGALVSLLGEDYVMNGHRHFHTNDPGSRSQGWHQDGTNVRHHQIRTVLAMYYPHDVPPEMGPTVILPGTHFRNAPTDRMATYANVLGQEFLTVKAGTVAITHYDLWHAATLNRTDRVRYMLKFLFDRRSAPSTPSWNHDPDRAKEALGRRIPEMVGPGRHYTSDYYKEWELRREMWDWLRGESKPVPPGGFRDLLSSS